MQREVFRSESGYRPMSAFVVVAAVLIGVAGRVAQVALCAEEGGGTVAVEQGLEPVFELADAHERTVAYFVDRLDLVASPRSMWLAHTPDHMAASLAEAIGTVSAEDVARALLPDAEGGWIEAAELPLNARQASAVLGWAERGGALGEAEPGPPLAGVDVVPAGLDGEKPRFLLRWQPAVLLSRSEREAHGERSPTRWTRRLLDGLSAALFLDAEQEDEARGTDANEACRRFVWSKLMPTGHCLAARDVPAERALEVERMLKEEGVSPLQMRLVRGRDRRYPTGALEIFGTWGRIEGDEPEPLPRDGLELLAERVFEDQDLGLAASEPAAYAFMVQRNRALGRTQYYLGRREAETPPRVVTTLDLDLLRTVRRELTGVMEEHDPAVAMAIVIDLERGDVLAVDSLEKYPVQPFAPVYYAFTPGSTFKLLTMAVALEEKKVRPDERFDVGDGRAYHLPDCKRWIREAEGSRSGSITAAECLAYSVNIGLVLIGQRLDPEVFRGKLRELGYGTAPGAGLGPEHPGLIPQLPWKKNWELASVSFGHEVMTTLWQHATGLSAVVRGGVLRPLRLISAVEQNGVRHEIPLDPGKRVFSAETCATIREMMSMGASVGTGRKVARPDLVMGTKTGTAEKVPSEICAHVAGAARQAAQEAGRPFTGKDYQRLAGVPKPHGRKSCYTSSMCIVGRPVEGGREIMVLLVVDEPTGKAKFGSDVAGPAAARILAEALGRTVDGTEVVPVLGNGFALASETGQNQEVEPWRAR